MMIVSSWPPLCPSHRYQTASLWPDNRAAAEYLVRSHSKDYKASLAQSPPDQEVACSQGTVSEERGRRSGSQFSIDQLLRQDNKMEV